MTNEELYHYSPCDLYDEGFVADLLDDIEERWYQQEIGE